MSSLIRCTDALLQHKAVQSTHYERLERQLLDRERRQRAVALALKQRIADVQRRGNDVADLRRENCQLAEQLAQHGLQLAALQCRGSAAQRAQAAAVERLHDGVRRWSGYPAQMVLLLQALQAEKKLRRSAKQFMRVLQSISHALRLHRRIRAFHTSSSQMLRWHTEQHTRLTTWFESRTQVVRQAREAALQEAAEARAELAGSLAHARCQAVQRRCVLEAQNSLLDVYEDSVRNRCEMAQQEVADLSAQVDAAAAELSQWEETSVEAATHLTDVAASLSRQRSRHAEASAAFRHQQEQRISNLADMEAAITQTQACVRGLTDSGRASQQRAQMLLQQAVAVDVAVDLCGRLRWRCACQRAAQDTERAAVEQELAQLRREHAQKLRERQEERVAAQQRMAVESLSSLESQRRRAAVQLEEDEWRLLHAQLVRDACRARAAAAAAAAEAATLARSEAEKKRQTKTKGAAMVKEGTVCGKHYRGTGASARTSSAASRRQRAALEAVDLLTLTASQGSRVSAVTPASALHASSRPPQKAAVGGAAGVAPLPSVAAVTPRASRAAYRLVSMRPSLAKRPADGVDGAQASSRPAKHARTATAMSPYMAAAEESDSSFSLRHDSGFTEAGVAAGRDEETSAVRLASLSLSPSPSPRCPLGRTHAPNSTAAATTRHVDPLPRRAHAAAGVSVQAGGAEKQRAVLLAQRSALDAALLTARTPRPAALGIVSPVARNTTASSGNVTALPRGGGGGGVARVHAAAVYPPQRAPAGGPERRRVPPLMPTALGSADDLFADLYS